MGEQLPYKQWVTGSSPVAPTTKDSADEYLCGNGSVVERHLAKVNVAGSNLVSRSTNSTALFFYFQRATAAGGLEHAENFTYKKVKPRRYSQEVRHGPAKP